MNQIHIKNRLYMLPALLFCLGLHGTEAMQQNITELNAAQSNAEVAPDLYNYVNEQAPDVSDTSVNRRHNRPRQKPKPNQQFSPAMYKQGQSGTLDLSFGNGKGYVVSPIGKAYAVAVQPDGKILVGGSHKKTRSSEPDSFCLARYNTNGSLDTTFGNFGSGFVLTSILAPTGGIDNTIIKTIAIQNDGKIIAGGSGCLVRYMPNGLLDREQFGGYIKGILAKNETGMQEITSIIIQDDGKIIAAGSGSTITQFNSNGSINRVFDVGGRGNVVDMVNIVTILAQGNGKTIAAGLGLVSVYHRGRYDYEYYPVVMRHNSDGSLDTSFGPHGTGMSYFYNEKYFEDGFASVIFCAIGKNTNNIVLAGRLYRNKLVSMSFTSSGHLRYEREEWLDTSIKAVLPYQLSEWDDLFLTAEEPRFIIANRNEWLDLEENFGNNGIAEIPGKENISITALSYAQNNKFVAVGFSSSDEFIIARYYN